MTTWLDDPVNRALACHTCGGLGYVEDATPKSPFAVCPYCFAHATGISAYDVSWDARTKAFSVVLKFPLPNDVDASRQLMAVLPAYIAQQSRCSCGAPLELRDHTLSVHDGRGSLRGTFSCGSCGSTRPGALLALKNSIASIWRQIVRVKVGPTGVEFEKTAGAPDERGRS